MQGRRAGAFCRHAAPRDPSFSSVDEELLKELEQMPIVLTTQDEQDVVEVVRGLKVGQGRQALLCASSCSWHGLIEHHVVQERFSNFRSWLRPVIRVRADAFLQFRGHACAALSLTCSMHASWYAAKNIRV